MDFFRLGGGDVKCKWLVNLVVNGGSAIGSMVSKFVGTCL